MAGLGQPHVKLQIVTRGFRRIGGGVRHVAHDGLQHLAVRGIVMVRGHAHGLHFQDLPGRNDFVGPGPLQHQAQADEPLHPPIADAADVGARALAHANGANERKRANCLAQGGSPYAQLEA